MYPYLKLITTHTKAHFRPKITIEDKSVLEFRVGISDIDPFMELNNARYFNYMELARWDYSYRTGFVDLMKKNRWGVAVGGASIRYRRRIPFLTKFTMTTQALCHDERWFYFLQETHIKDTICSSALMKVCALSKSGLVPAPEVVKQMGYEGWGDEMPDWVSAWIEAEGQRPWPEK